MKHHAPSLLLALVALCCGPLFLGSCASTNAANTEPLLSAAGFVSRTPQNTKQQELYNAMPSYKVHRGEYKGKVIYAYKNEEKGTAYVGDEAAYQRYQQLAVERQIARDNYMAAQMNRDMAYGWYGAYGPYVYRGARW